MPKAPTMSLANAKSNRFPLSQGGSLTYKHFPSPPL